MGEGVGTTDPSASVGDPGRLELPRIDYSGRFERLGDVLSERSLDALLVTEPVNVRWLTGFTGSSGIVAVVRDHVVLVTDRRYGERALSEVASAGTATEVLVGATQAELSELIVQQFALCESVGAESARLSYQRFVDFDRRVTLTPTDGIIEDLRRCKSPGEIARMRFAARCADAALSEVLPAVDGMTERDVRTELEYRMRVHGADGPSYDTIVASGPDHAARPHHEVSDRVIRESDTVVIDVGALVDGYHSDMTRSFVIGPPTPEQARRYGVLAEAQRAGTDAVRVGVAASTIDAACRDVLAAAGLSQLYIHGTGHGVGLEIHERPLISAQAEEVIGCDETITVEPGIYEPGFGGFRIEDLVRVTENEPDILTGAPKSWSSGVVAGPPDPYRV